MRHVVSRMPGITRKARLIALRLVHVNRGGWPGARLAGREGTCSGVLEGRLALLDEGRHAFLLVLGREDRKSVVQGKSVSVRVDLGGRLSIKQKNKICYKLLYKTQKPTTT